MKENKASDAAALAGWLAGWLGAYKLEEITYMMTDPALALISSGETIDSGAGCAVLD